MMLLVGTCKTNIRVRPTLIHKQSIGVQQGTTSVEYVAEMGFSYTCRKMIGLTWLIILPYTFSPLRVCKREHNE